MPQVSKSQNKVRKLAREIGTRRAGVLKLLISIAQKLKKKGEERLEKLVQKEQKKIEKELIGLEIKAHALEETIIADRHELENKKKELLAKTQEVLLKISIRNKELQEQKLQITEQSEKLREAHEQIVEKNNELEQQTESLLDQTDYLYEANKTITHMHEEVQQQKIEIETKNEALLALNLEKNNLISIVAHDLKSPLNQIKGLLTIIKMNNDGMSEETLQCIDMVEKSATRLNEMIVKILDVEAIESKTLNLAIEKVNLTQVLRGVVNRYLLNAREKQIEILSDIEENIFVEADRAYAEQIFDNLLSNALKFSTSFKKVYVNLYLKDGQVVGEIKDEGPGLTEEDKKKLFGKYQKLTARPTANEASTGLGLSIVKKFTDAMNGNIWCDSVQGKGASFFVSFPHKHQVTTIFV